MLVTVALCLISALLFLRFASQWRKKALASVEEAEISPRGCYRLVQYALYWSIPGSFHPARDVQEQWTPFDGWHGPRMPNEAPPSSASSITAPVESRGRRRLTT